MEASRTACSLYTGTTISTSIVRRWPGRASTVSGTGVLMEPEWRPLFGREAEAVADASDRMDEGRIHVIDFAAQIVDVGLEDGGVAGEGVVPDVLQDLVPCQPPGGVGHRGV